MWLSHPQRSRNGRKFTSDSASSLPLKEGFEHDNEHDLSGVESASDAFYPVTIRIFGKLGYRLGALSIAAKAWRLHNLFSSEAQASDESLFLVGVIRFGIYTVRGASLRGKSTNE